MNIFIAPFYVNSPVNIQKCMVHAQGLACSLMREGGVFKKILRDLEKSQYYSEEELRRLQNEKLRRMVKHSYENVPYYRRLFKRLSLRPSDFKDISDLDKLPFISKKDVKGNSEDFLA
ncbi:MAG: phenylacetate--CoA ligase family protein, partial [Candidatus Omnitrophica bacterium]|nr:phenylacetate--CoA ligase family protein [Candidatus Omnitrophota bacterium]